ncbi:hypothetical protein BB559_007429 [Furculomyces boomerangus]|uniref:SPX domain-containing protein n=1 Tax=Furculomyces boomerangus TaxID=61424 RepID=A0A2T9XXI2_9FUNG|nr:hypothetical protein BB559_007429 [Furculomyces boomerangus]
MKFGKYLESEAVPEWSTKYIDYKGLKKCIKRISGKNEEETHLQHISNSILRFNRLNKKQSNQTIDNPVSDNMVNTEHDQDESKITHPSNFPVFLKAGSSSNSPKSEFIGNTDSNFNLYRTSSLQTSFEDISNTGDVVHRNVSSNSSNKSIVPIVGIDDKVKFPQWDGFSNIHNQRVYKNPKNANSPSSSSDDVNKSLLHKSGSKNNIEFLENPNLENSRPLQKYQQSKSLSVLANGGVHYLEGDTVLIKRNSTRYYPENILKGYATTKKFKEMLNRRSVEERAFFEACEMELKKVNDFFKDKENTFLYRVSKIVNQQNTLNEMKKSNEASQMENGYDDKLVENIKYLDEYTNVFTGPLGFHGRSNILNIGANREENLKATITKAKRKIKKAIMEIYRALEMLKNFRVLNNTGFRKILKKYTKETNWVAGSSSYMHKVQNSYFLQSEGLDRALEEIMNLYCINYADGSPERAKTALRMPLISSKTHNRSIFVSGFSLGMVIPLIVNIIYLVTQRDNWINRYVVLYIYSCTLLVLLFFVLFSTNMLAWYYSNINYKFIFMFDPRDNLSPWQFFKFSSVMLLCSTSLMEIDILKHGLNSDKYFGIGVLIFNLIILFIPVNLFYYSSRRWLLNSFKRLLFAGFFPVEFRDFFLGDCLCSLGYSISIFYFLGCMSHNKWPIIDQNICVPSLSVSGTVVLCIPNLIRFIQCIRRYIDSSHAFPHLYNAGKYALALVGVVVMYLNSVKGTNGMKILAIVLMTLSSAYSAFWDLYMDWGFFEEDAKYLFLRKELKFNFIPVYYFAMITDPLMRFVWIANFIPLPLIGGQKLSKNVLRFALALVEVIRRYQWCFFRLENEHVNNCGQFRATIEIPLPFASNKKTD